MTDPFLLAAHLGSGFDPLSMGSAAPVRASNNWWSSSRGWAGDKFPGSFGETKFLFPDYWELRTRSAQLFRENLYARGLVRRLVTNEINVGLSLEAEPITDLISRMSEEAIEGWTEEVESRFEVWANEPRLCDFEERRPYGELQEEVRREALVEGDILVVLRPDRRTGLPRLQFIRGGRIRTPLKEPKDGNRIVHGVELDSRGRHVGFWISNGLNDPVRIPAFGSRSGRRTAWLVYGTDRRCDQVRGEPLLGLVLSSIKELDRYRDSEQRAATINSLLAMFIQKDTDKPGTLPISGGATRVTRVDATGLQDEPREFDISRNWPGMILEELQQGEVPVSFDTKRPNAKYPEFEAAIIHAIAWACETPPEILTLAFSNNFSASKAAINEFKTYIVKVRKNFGNALCRPVYIEWLIAEVLASRIDAPGFLESWRDPLQYDVFGAWVRSTWGGPVKPSVEMRKDLQAYGEAIELNLITHDRASKDMFGVRFSTVLRRLKKERKQVADMNDDLGISNEPPEPGAIPAPGVPAAARVELSKTQLADLVDGVTDNVVELFQSGEIESA